MEDGILIEYRDCRIGPILSPALTSVDWTLRKGETWVVAGPNGGGKSAFAAAVAGSMELEPNEGGAARSAFAEKAVLVSFEEAAELLQRERANDDSEYADGGVAEGTTARAYIGEAAGGTVGLERHPAVAACGAAPFLDRGLKRLSTGEIRRVLLARALASGAELLVLDEPYEGLDAASRRALEGILDALAAGDGKPVLVLVADRWEHIPAAANRVVELRERRIAYCGPREGYERLAAEREPELDVEARAALLERLEEAEAASDYFAAARKSAAADADAGVPLIEFNDVSVEWSGRKVLDGVSWRVERGEHWLIRGPNGSGKTTILELISGDNPQVFRNDVRLFGRRRGSGETIWELKERMGIVSYRLHLEYRYLDDARLEEVLISGLHDSIGLYREIGDAERLLAARWLELAGFAGRAAERFGSLSFGEQRALLVARGAIKGPELFILDEPCHGLDEGHRDRVLALLEAVASRGASTLLYVTHDPAELLPCIKRTLELRPGRTPMWAAL